MVDPVGDGGLGLDPATAAQKLYGEPNATLAKTSKMAP
jgi:hypothetical protein